MAIRLTQINIDKLNNYIMGYYGKQINIFFIQGLFVSYLSYANLEIDGLAELLYGDNSVLLINKTVKEVDDEYLSLLHKGLFYSTAKYCDTHDNIIPMLSLDKVWGEYFRYVNITDNLQRNLLDWYIGYFYGFSIFSNHDLISKFLDDHQNPLPDGIVMSDLYTRAIDTQYVIAYNLITKFKPTHDNSLLNDVITSINHNVSLMAEDNFKIANQNAITCGCSMLSSILVISEAAREYYFDLQYLTKGKLYYGKT